MNSQTLSEMLGEIQFLRDMGPGHLTQLAQIASVEEFGENTIVFRQGDPAEHMYLVASGKISLEICAAGTGCKQILTLGPGELLGWSSHLGQSRYTALARTPLRTRLVKINVPQLIQLCDQDPRFGYDLMRRTAVALAKRLNATRIQLLNVYGDQLPVTQGS